MRWSEEQYQNYQQRHGQTTQAKPEKKKPPAPADRLNKTERKYADHLELLRASGEVLWWAFEPVKLRLAKRTWFLPDFLVRLADGSLEFHETKGGFVREDSLIKFKVAREQYPFFGWRMMRYQNGQWGEIYR